jgi:hypothetical protein
MRLRLPIVVAVPALALLAAVPAPAPAATKRTPACPRLAYQVGTGGVHVLHPVTYTRRGRTLRVSFTYLDAKGATRNMIRSYRVRGGKVKITAVREGKRGDGKVTTYRRSCAPSLKRAAKGKPGVYRNTVSLPQSFVWKLPGNHRAPAPAPPVAPPAPPSLPAPPAADPAPAVPPPAPAPAPVPGPIPPGPGRTSWTVLTAGDIAQCFTNDSGVGQHPGDGAIVTANLVRTLLPVDDLIVQGDLAYESGTASEFADCYEPTWGIFKAFTHPAPGNHEYQSSGASPYYAYWGARAGTAGRGYYSYSVGAWHVVSLNSEADLAASGQQATWLKADLAAHPARCTMAFWHRPRFSSDPLNGDTLALNPLYAILYNAGVDVLLQGHAHNYQRWNELAPDANGRGTIQRGRGIRSFVVGTGGADFTPPGTLQSGEDALAGNVFGVMQMTLTPTGYSWRFIPAPGYSYTDAGSGSCH